VDEYPERTKDPIHLERAAPLGRVLLTSDEDQEAIAVEWYRARRSFPGLVIGRQELNEQMRVLHRCGEPGDRGLTAARRAPSRLDLR
jgi:hypothetical protein